jgi:hypothetical protein
VKSVLLFAALLLVPATQAQKSMPAIKGVTEPDEPANPEPKATDFRDPKYKLSFHIPAGWNFERKDGVLTTFRAEVKTAKPGLDIRGIASINYNPYPPTTFAGATFYYSVLPKSDAATCTAMATTAPLKPQKDVVVAGHTFRHGEEHHGQICTEARDEVFTTLRGQSCLRFDMQINTFCHASSGAMEISPAQLNDINTRMAKILDSIRIE